MQGFIEVPLAGRDSTGHYWHWNLMHFFKNKYLTKVIWKNFSCLSLHRHRSRWPSPWPMLSTTSTSISRTGRCSSNSTWWMYVYSGLTTCTLQYFILTFQINWCVPYSQDFNLNLSTSQIMQCLFFYFGLFLEGLVDVDVDVLAYFYGLFLLVLDDGGKV